MPINVNNISKSANFSEVNRTIIEKKIELLNLDNIVLIEGDFLETMIDGNGPSKIMAGLIDCDLYSSTVDILEALKDRMQFGTIILFDEYFNYSNWENHEFKAWQEFVVKYQIQYEYIGFDRQQVAVKIMHIGK